MALPLAVMFGMLTVSFEILIPWTKDVKVSFIVRHVLATDLDMKCCPLMVRHSGTSCFQADEAAAGSLLSAKAWPSYICGFIVGCLQIPLVFGKCFSRVKPSYMYLLCVILIYMYMHDMIVYGKNSSNE